jgi:hypothetical protein
MGTAFHGPDIIAMVLISVGGRVGIGGCKFESEFRGLLKYFQEQSHIPTYVLYCTYALKAVELGPVNKKIRQLPKLF